MVGLCIKGYGGIKEEMYNVSVLKKVFTEEFLEVIEKKRIFFKEFCR